MSDTVGLVIIIVGVLPGINCFLFFKTVINPVFAVIRCDFVNEPRNFLKSLRLSEACNLRGVRFADISGRRARFGSCGSPIRDKTVGG